VHRVLVAAVLSVAFAGCSSSSNTDTPAAACNSLITAVCNRVFACDNAAATQAFGSVSNCITTGETAAGCSTAACSAGKTFNSGNASSCVNGISNAACADVEQGNYPAVCDNVCT